MAGIGPQYHQPPSWQAQCPPAYSPNNFPQGQQQGYQVAHRQSGYPQQGRPPGQTGPQTCYNCGSPDHWAQHCPEPRRAVPAGSLNRQNIPRPTKRHKSSGPIVTKYPVPPHVTMQHGPPQAYSGPPYNKPVFPQQQGPYAPPTPISAYGQPHHQWPQPQQQPYNAPYPQGYHYSQYGPQAPPTPATPHAAHYPSPVSAQGHAQQHGFFQQSGPHAQQGSPQTVDYGRRMNLPTAQITPSSQHWPQQPSSNDAGYTCHASSDFRKGPQPMSGNLGNSVEASDEPNSEEDDLQGLDIPDIPTGKWSIAWHPPRFVYRPLASDYFAEEVIATLPPPPPKADGNSISRYFTATNHHDSIRSVRETSDWAAFKDDPAFQQIADDQHYIPFGDLTAHRTVSKQDREDIDLDTEEGELSQEPNAAGNQVMKKDSHGWNVMDNLEQALNSGDFSAAAKSESIQLRHQSEDSVDETSARTAEEELASLGVSGLSKPVHAPARPYPPSNTADDARHNFVGGVPRSRSCSSEVSKPSDRDSTPMQYTSQKSPSYFDKYQERESTPPRQGSHNAKHHINPDRKPTYDSINKEYERPTTERLRSQQESNPPVSRRRVSSINIGLNVSPPSSDSSHGHKHTVNGGLSGYNGPGKRGSNGYATSPPTLRSERTNPRKREFDHRESSEEHEHERRRQADDITPKLKRRQPKVAEAYSRRW